MPLVIDQFKRKYQKSVKDFILNIWKEFGFTYILEEDSDLDDIQKHYIDNGGAFYILRNDDKVMGTIGLVAKTDNTIELTRLYIDKSQRSKGFGSKLVDRAIEFSRKSGFIKIKLNSNKIFKKAHNLYKRKGFFITKEDKEDFYMERGV